MSTDDYVAWAIGIGCALMVTGIVVRLHRVGRRAVEHFLAREGLHTERIVRRLHDGGPFGLNLRRNVTVFPVSVTDAASRRFTVWFRFEHDLLGRISETETKFEHVNRS